MSVRRPDAPSGDRIVAERYHLRQRIGSGGMSLVYLADEGDRRRPVALKFLRSAFANLPGFVRRFEREAEACRRLAHDNCVKLHDFGMEHGVPYLVMEYVDGVTLGQWLKSERPGPRRVLDVTRQILGGLSHAHERGVIHRDLKPANVMLLRRDDGASQVKIMDFGTAELLTSGAGAESTGTDIGTPWYMAPEQAGGGATDHRTDLYAVGVMLFELLTGERPYVADSPMRVLQMHLSSPIPSIRALRPQMGLSPELEQIIAQAMQKDPDQRFADAAQFERALGRVAEATARVRRPPPDAALPPPVFNQTGPAVSLRDHYLAERAQARARLLSWLTVAATGLLVAIGIGILLLVLS